MHFSKKSITVGLGIILASFLGAKAAFAGGPTKVIFNDNLDGKWRPGSSVTQLELNPDGKTGTLYMHGVSAKGLEFENLCSVQAPEGLETVTLRQNPQGKDTAVSRDEENKNYLGIFVEGPGGKQWLVSEAPRVEANAPVFIHGKGNINVSDVTKRAKETNYPFPPVRSDCREIIDAANSMEVGKLLMRWGGKGLGLGGNQ